MEYLYKKRDFQGVAKIIIGLSNYKEIDVSNLLENPSDECAKLNLKYIECAAPLNQCIYGKYDKNKLEISVYITSSDFRNLFTLAHEIGHHFIVNSEDWLLISYEDRIGDRRGEIEEKIANAIASEILIPSPTYQKALPKDQISARNLASLYESVNCSPSALLYRVQQELNNTQKLIIGFSNLRGESFSSYSLMSGNDKLLPIAKGSTQEALAVVGEVLENQSTYIGVPHEPFMNKAGTSRGNFHVEAVRVQAEDLYFFCMEPSKSELSSSSKANKFCSKCLNELDDIFNPTIRQCGVCKEYICAECSRCSCQEIECPPCEICFLTVSVAQASQGKKVCESCE